MTVKYALDHAFTCHAPLDLLPEPFLFDLNWPAQALIDAVNGAVSLPQGLKLMRSANDADAHRPRRRAVFLAVSPLPMRFRIGG
jgi:hypothetical protein